MTFKKRFLMCLAIVGVLLVPSMAKADANGAVALNKWFKIAPDTAMANFDSLNRTSTRVGRGQTVYFVVQNVGNAMYTVQDAVMTLCAVSDPITGCASAPLFIASAGARVCIDSSDASIAAGGAVAGAYTCTDAACLRLKAIESVPPLLESTDTGRCVEANGTGTEGNVNPLIPSGRSTVYYNLTVGPTTPNATTVISVTGY